MAKNMARIRDGIVINIEWCANKEEETDVLRETNGCLVEIGDTYDGSRFYHNGEVLLSPIEELQLEVYALRNENKSIKEENANLTECILEMSEVIYA